MARKSGAFSGRVLDDAAICVLDSEVDITIAAGDHAHTSNPLFREAIVEGNNLLVVYRQNQTVHGLSKLQVGISTGRQGTEPDEHGFCVQLTPTNKSITYNSEGQQVISREAYEQWSKLQSLGRRDEASQFFTSEVVPTEAEVRESLAVLALDGDTSDEEVFTSIMQNLPGEVVDRFPHQTRGPRIINSVLHNIDDSMLDDMEEDELMEMYRVSSEQQPNSAITKMLHRYIFGNGEAASLQKLWSENQGIVGKIHELEGRLERLLDVMDNFGREPEDQLELDDINMQLEELDRQQSAILVKMSKAQQEMKGSAPLERANWGLPQLVYQAYVSGERLMVRREVNGEIIETPSKNQALHRRRFAGFVAEAELTCIQVADMAMEEHGADISLLRKKGEKPVTYELISQVIAAEEQRYMTEYTSWVNGSDAVSRSLNMGDLVEALGEWQEGLDARPRQTMADEPVSELVLGDFEEDALKRDLSRKSTPRDEQVWMGELNSFSSDVPFIQTEDGAAGHPLAWLISSILGAMAQDHEVSQIVDEDGERVMPEKVEILRLLGVSIDGTTEDHWTTNIGEGAGIILGMDGNVSVVRLKTPATEFGFVYEIQESDAWAIGKPDDKGELWKEGDVVGFNSRLGFLVWRMSLTTFPTLATEEDGKVAIVNGNTPFIPTTWVPVYEVFPKLWAFGVWARDEYETGAGWMGDNALDDDMTEKLWELQAELSQYQERMMALLVEVNVEVHFGDFIAELGEAWELYAENQNVAMERGSFSDLDGRPTSLYGRLSNVLWASARGMTGENLIAPRPVRVEGVKLSEDMESEVRMWGLNETMLWRVMGYGLHPKRYRQGLDGLANMVRERIVRSNPLDAANRTEWWWNPIEEKSHRRQVHKALVTWTDSGLWSVGALGDALAEWWRTAVGIHHPSVKGNMLAMDTTEIQQKLGWDADMTRRFLALSKVWGRSKELRNSGFEKLLEMLLPLPSTENFEVYKRIYKMRLQLMSSSPLTTGAMFETAMGLIDGDEKQRKLFLATLRTSVDEVGLGVVRELTTLIG